MSTKIFINLPVKDLATSRRFFAELGFAFNQDFADENMECVIISDGIYVMLLVAPYFQTFTKKEIADAAQTTEMINALGSTVVAFGDSITDGSAPRPAPTTATRTSWRSDWSRPAHREACSTPASTGTRCSPTRRARPARRPSRGSPVTCSAGRPYAR